MGRAPLLRERPRRPRRERDVAPHVGGVALRRHHGEADEFLGDSPLARAVFEMVSGSLSQFDDVTIRTTRSQIAFRRRRGFAYIWLPGMYLKKPHADVVLSVALDRELPSSRFKETVHPSPGIWQHHLEVQDVDDLDDEVRDWLVSAYWSAG